MDVSRRQFGSISLAAAAGATALPQAGGAKAAAGSAGTSGAAKADGILVPEHFVPTPTTISKQSQDFLRKGSPYGGGGSGGPPMHSKDPALWQAFRKMADAGVAMLYKKKAEVFPAKLVEHQLTHTRLFEITPENIPPENAGKAILYVHGGAFFMGNGEAAVYPAWVMGGLARIKIYSAEYRLAPEDPFPRGVDDVVEAYRFMLDRHPARHIAVFGGSAGANIAPGALLKARDAGLPLPAACALLSVPSDMSGLGDTEHTNVYVDVILQKRDPQRSLNYVGDTDPRNPYLSPVYADYSKGFSPTVLTSGTRDILLSGTVRLHRAMVRAGVKAELHVWEAQPHGPAPDSPEEAEVYRTHIEFMLRHMEGKV